MRTGDQVQRDEDRCSFVVRFPSDLKADQVEAWLQAVSGSLKTSGFGLDGKPTMAVEMLATTMGIAYRIRVPSRHGDYIAAQLRTLVPGTSVTPQEDKPPCRWSRVVELGETAPSRLLSIPNAAALAASVLASVQSLKDGEMVMTQWVLTTARPSRPPVEKTGKQGKSEKFANLLFGITEPTREEISELRAKQKQVNFLGVLRIGAKAEDDFRAGELVSRVRTALSGADSSSNRFRTRARTQAQLLDGINEARTPLNFPGQFAASELAGLLGWPIGQPHVAGLPQGHTRQLPPSGSVSRVGRVVAISNFPGAERPLALTTEDGLKHLHVVGPIGVGKTTLLTNLVAQDIMAGHGVVVIESKGDLFQGALQAVPKDRVDDVIVMDVTDEHMPVGFNILEQGTPRAVVDELCALFEYLYRDARSVYTREILFHGLSTLVSRPGVAFVDLTALLAPRSDSQKRWRDNLLDSLTDPELKNFWQRFKAQPPMQQDRYVYPVLDRIWQLNSRPEIRNVIGQTKSGFSMADVIRKNKILLVNLAGLGQETASLAGTLLINALWGAVKRNRPKVPNFLYIDEFQDFMNLPLSLESMTVQARSFGLGMVLAHQHLDQLPIDMRNAALANLRSKILFQTSSGDARTFASEFGPLVKEHDFLNLGRHEVIARLVTPDGVSSPMTGRTPPPFAGYGLGEEVWRRARERYGRPRDVVMDEIAMRTSAPEPKTPKRPKLGAEEWKP